MRRDGKFVYVVDSAKKGDNAHGKERTGFVDALVKYGSEARRYQAYTEASDLEYIRDHANPDIVKRMGYPPADPTKVQSS